MEKYIEEGKKFIENELRYSFASMETRRIANSLLTSFNKGVELAQKDMYSEEEVKKLLKLYDDYEESPLKIQAFNRWFDKVKK